MGEISVAIADDNERILELLGDIISTDKDLRLVGKANNGEDMCRSSGRRSRMLSSWI